MIAPRASPWAVALCTPLLLSQARGRHAHRAVRLLVGVRAVFDLCFNVVMLRTLGRMIYALCTLHLLDLLLVLVLSFVGLVVLAIGATLLGGEFPNRGLFEHRVRLRLYHPLLQWLVPARYHAV